MYKIIYVAEKVQIMHVAAELESQYMYGSWALYQQAIISVGVLSVLQCCSDLFKNIVMAGIIAKKMKFPALCLYLTCTCTSTFESTCTLPKSFSQKRLCTCTCT